VTRCTRAGSFRKTALAHPAPRTPGWNRDDGVQGHTRSGADDESRTRGPSTHETGVAVLCQLSYIREDCKANHRPVPRSPCGNLLKSGPPACRWCDPSIAWPAPMRRPDGNEKGPDPFGIRASAYRASEGVRLCASLSRMHLVLVLVAPLGSLQRGKVQCVRITARLATEGHRGAHERTPAHDGRGVGDQWLAVHDESFGNETIGLFRATGRIVKSLYPIVNPQRQWRIERRRRHTTSDQHHHQSPAQCTGAVRSC
jgi:hypothetical protein